MVNKLYLGGILSIQSQLQVSVGESYHYCLFLLCGEWKDLSHILQLNLPCTWWTEQLYNLDNSYFPLFLILRVIVFCFACKYSWATINVKCIYQKWTLDVLCKTKQKKKNNWQFVWKVNLYWFLNLPVNRRLCTRGWRLSKRTPPNNQIGRASCRERV